MDNKDKIQRGKDIDELMKLPGWKFWLLPDIERLIEKSGSIKQINEQDIERSYYKQIIKVDIYKGFIERLNTWISEGKQLEQGGK